MNIINRLFSNTPNRTCFRFFREEFPLDDPIASAKLERDIKKIFQGYVSDTYIEFNPGWTEQQRELAGRCISGQYNRRELVWECRLGLEGRPLEEGEVTGEEPKGYLLEGKKTPKKVIKIYEEDFSNKLASQWKGDCFNPYLGSLERFTDQEIRKGLSARRYQIVFLDEALFISASRLTIFLQQCGLVSFNDINVITSKGKISTPLGILQWIASSIYEDCSCEFRNSKIFVKAVFFNGTLTLNLKNGEKCTIPTRDSKTSFIALLLDAALSYHIENNISTEFILNGMPSDLIENPQICLFKKEDWVQWTDRAASNFTGLRFFNGLYPVRGSYSDCKEISPSEILNSPIPTSIHYTDPNCLEFVRETFHNNLLFQNYKTPIFKCDDLDRFPDKKISWALQRRYGNIELSHMTLWASRLIAISQSCAQVSLAKIRLKTPVGVMSTPLGMLQGISATLKGPLVFSSKQKKIWDMLNAQIVSVLADIVMQYYVGASLSLEFQDEFDISRAVFSHNSLKITWEGKKEDTTLRYDPKIPGVLALLEAYLLYCIETVGRKKHKGGI